MENHIEPGIVEVVVDASDPEKHDVFVYGGGASDASEKYQELREASSSPRAVSLHGTPVHGSKKLPAPYEELAEKAILSIEGFELAAFQIKEEAGRSPAGRTASILLTKAEELRILAAYWLHPENFPAASDDD